jgi:2-polyprenyl-3-methyl-5-hydroxy-6-metoxy-1,4-benzoquinol methylase
MVVPTDKSVGEIGANAIDDNFGVAAVVEFIEHAAMPQVNTSMVITARHKLINPTCFLFMVIIYSSLFTNIIRWLAGKNISMSGFIVSATVRN